MYKFLNLHDINKLLSKKVKQTAFFPRVTLTITLAKCKK